MYVFVFKYRRWKGSTDSKNGTEIDSWLDRTVFMWLIVLIRWCRGEWGLLFELIQCWGDPSGGLDCHIYCVSHGSFYAVSWMKNTRFFLRICIMPQVWVRVVALLSSQRLSLLSHGERASPKYMGLGEGRWLCGGWVVASHKGPQRWQSSTGQSN